MKVKRLLDFLYIDSLLCGGFIKDKSNSYIEKFFKNITKDFQHIFTEENMYVNLIQ